MADFETKDSGKREEFATGSRRDTREGKGRFDLIPWGIIRQLRAQVDGYAEIGADIENEAMEALVDGVNGDLDALRDAATIMLSMASSEDDGEECPVSDKVSWSSIAPLGLTRLAKLYERGAAKYGDRNWEKGQPLDRYLDSALRHFNAYRAGQKDEDHLIATVWNIIGYLWTKEKNLAPTQEKAAAGMVALGVTGESTDVLAARGKKLARYQELRNQGHTEYCNSNTTSDCTEYLELKKELGL